MLSRLGSLTNKSVTCKGVPLQGMLPKHGETLPKDAVKSTRGFWATSETGLLTGKTSIKLNFV